MFVRGGYVDPGYYLRYAGNYGRYWSSVGLNRYDAYSLYLGSGNVGPSYSLYLGSGNVGPSGNDTRYDGFSIRCVALGG